MPSAPSIPETQPPSPGDPATAGQSSQSPQLEWRSWPLKRHARWSWWLPLVIVGSGVWVGTQLESLTLGTATGICVTLPLLWFLVPTRVRLDAQGVTLWRLGHRRQLGWERIGGYREDPLGVVLLPARGARPIAGVLGTCLPCDGNREAVIALLDAQI